MMRFCCSLNTEVNDVFRDEVASKFIITIGDEFQGLLKRPDKVMDICRIIKTKMHPVRFRISIGIGDIYTEINPELSIGADGPAYHIARDNIEVMKKAEQGYVNPDYSMLVGCESENPDGDLINGALAGLTYIENGWSVKQMEVIQALDAEGVSQRDLAEKLGIAQSSVQRRVKSSGYYTYRYIEDEIQKKINRLWEAINGE